ncbi:cadherin-like beta sandwich domain-containing protein [Undibacterium sp. TJN25]|uniref:cadherin-like beta sandwich domain-containing protein n=1 Tax=Undibacterium sp. TJN25 TaxID=3413056 RepID=UPI003BF0636A
MTSPSTDSRILSRRKALLLGAFGATALAGCGGGSGSSASTASDTTTVVSKDDTLSALGLSAGSLSPAFSSAIDLYSVSVANSVASVTLTPVSGSAAASIKVNGAVVASGTASAAISLAVGTTNITITVTAEDGVTISTITITATRAAAVSAQNLAVIAQDEIGPFPLLAILSNAAIVRKDIRESKAGLPLTLNLTLTNINSQSQPLANAAVYIWQCNKDGEYSGYSSPQNGNHQGETYLRGIQITDGNGQVSFTTIYPGWYAGRITHIHAQIYVNDNLNVTATATTQFAFPDAVTTAVYATSLYTHGQNTSVASTAADHVFSDGTSTQMLSLAGDTTGGYVATLNISIAA